MRRCASLSCSLVLITCTSFLPTLRAQHPGGGLAGGGGGMEMSMMGDAGTDAWYPFSTMPLDGQRHGIEINVTKNIRQVAAGEEPSTETIRGQATLFSYRIGSLETPAVTPRSNQGYEGMGGYDDAGMGAGMGGGYGDDYKEYYGMGGGMGMDGDGGGYGAGEYAGDDFGDGMGGGMGEGDYGMGGYGLEDMGGYGGPNTNVLQILAVVSERKGVTGASDNEVDWKKPIALLVHVVHKDYGTCAIPLDDLQQLAKKDSRQGLSLRIREIPPEDEVQLISNQIQQHLRLAAITHALKKSAPNATPTVIEQMESDLRDLLAAQYQSQIAEQEMQIQRIQDRVDRLRSQVRHRKAALERVVDVKVGTMILEAQGLLQPQNIR